MLKTIFLLLCAGFHLFALENYTLDARQFWKDKTLFLVIRRFEQNDQTRYLTLNTQTLQTRLANVDERRLEPISLQALAQTPFAQSLNAATALWQKGGIDHALRKRDATLFLTMDLCPSSKKGYESAFIRTLTRQNGQTPIAVAISSAWLEHHEAEFEALRSDPDLNITWVNHTHTHFYDRTLPDRENFMLHQGTDVQAEILNVEQRLIEKGVTPSIFFRFPGLIADERLMRALRERYFLIPLSADAWIAKNQRPESGSFILIHGNKNEPLGIDMLERMLPDLLKRYRFKAIEEAFVP